MRIGIEEPLVANHQLYATSVAGTAELADFTVAGLNRYSFTQIESAEIANVMHAISLASGEMDARWVYLWQWGRNDEKIRDLHRRNRFVRAGFRFQIRDGLAVCVGPAVRDFRDAFAVPSELPRDAYAGANVVVWGTEDHANQVAAWISCKELHGSKIYPSETTLQRLTAARVTMVYRSADNRGRIALIAITPHKLAVAGLPNVTASFIGSEAGRAWGASAVR